MKLSTPLTRLSNLSAIALLASGWTLFPADLYAAEQQETKPKPPTAQQLFASPEAAITALQTATRARDKAAMRRLFGQEYDQLLTGDEIQDANHLQRFATELAQGCKPIKEGDDKIILEVGSRNWPMPIPLVKADGQWHFDTEAGKEEIINRHIGRDELHAIGVCRAYVAAQRQFASMNAGGAAKYAQTFKSTPGKKDGLYWPATGTEPASPFGPLVAQAHAEGYGRSTDAGPHPFHGYYFRILTRQGKAAPGGEMSYLSHGNLTKGFALLAYPEHWDRSGIMTFIVNQDGIVFQRNLGEKTSQIAAAMSEYNPDNDWLPVRDPGEIGAVLEK